MNDFIEQQRRRIAEQLQISEARIAEVEEAARRQGGERSESELGPAEDFLADASEQLDDRAAARTELTEQIRGYKRALDRINQGSYQQCERCGRTIAEERLTASPTATFCIDCQRELEREQGER